MSHWSASRITEWTDLPPASTTVQLSCAVILDEIALTSWVLASRNAPVSVSNISGAMSERSDSPLTTKRLLSAD